MGVSARLSFADGRHESLRSAWLVGCDGAHRAVRHRLGLRFEGAPYEEEFLLGDFAVEWGIIVVGGTRIHR